MARPADDPTTDDPVALLSRLIAIDSVNPSLVPHAAGEGRIASFCADWLQTAGFEVHRLEATPGRPSVVGVARGSGGGRSLMLNGHTDTVSVAGYEGDPFLPRSRGNRVEGRGAFDMKSGLAAIMVAARRAARRGLRGDLLVACVADEEFGSLGTEEVLGRFRADAAIIAEPSQLQVTVAHRGFAWFEIVLSGRAAHGSMPEQGIDAIDHAGLVLAAFGELRRALRALPPHPLLGTGDARVAMVRGGEDAATVAAECRLTVERRMLPGQTPDEVEAEIRSLLTTLAGSVPDFRWTLTRLVARAGYQADPTWPIVRTVIEEAATVLGAPPPLRGEPFWTDAGLFDQVGIPCLLFGVQGGGAHAATEWVSVDSIHQATAILEQTALRFCGAESLEPTLPQGLG